jgi:hypothetical protein
VSSSRKKPAEPVTARGSGTMLVSGSFMPPP